MGLRAQRKAARAAGPHAGRYRAGPDRGIPADLAGDRRILGRPYERGLRDRPGCLFVFMNEHLPRVAGLAIREEREAIHTAWELTHVGLSARCRGGRSTPPGAHRRSPRACAAISRRLDGQRRMPKSKKSGAACQIGGASQH